MSATATRVVGWGMSSDAELVSAARAGEDAAFGELYRRYRPRITLFVRGFVRDQGSAEDVVQEAFVSALRRLRATDREIIFKPWIYEIARNRAIDVLRRAGRTSEVSLDATPDAGDVLRLTAPRGPHAIALEHERMDHLRGAFGELSPTHHRILVLRELEGLSYREIGARMELTPNAVESALFRARRRLELEYNRRRGHGRRAAALLPLPALFRRRVEDLLTPLAGGGSDLSHVIIAKAAVLVTAAALAGGAALTVDGPRGPERAHDRAPAAQRAIERPARAGDRPATPRAPRTAPAPGNPFSATPSVDRAAVPPAARRLSRPSSAREVDPTAPAPAPQRSAPAPSAGGLRVGPLSVTPPGHVVPGDVQTGIERLRGSARAKLDDAGALVGGALDGTGTVDTLSPDGGGE